MPESRAFLLVHGYANHRPPEHWEHWLADLLTDAGQGVVYPQFPSPEDPTLGVWLDALLTHLYELSGLEASERIVICHSLGCLLWLHAAAAGIPAPLRPNRLILVSPPASAQIPERASGFEITGVDGVALRASVTGEIRIVCSDDDPYCSAGAPAVYGEPLGIPCDIIPGAGHISRDDGYGPWPEMLAWCERPGGPIRAQG